MNKTPMYDIPPKIRELFFRVLNHQTDIHPLTMRFHYLIDHFPSNKLELALVWLVKNNIIGKNFLKWFRIECHGSDLEMHAKLLAIVDNDKIRPIIAGKNFRL